MEEVDVEEGPSISIRGFGAGHRAGIAELADP